MCYPFGLHHPELQQPYQAPHGSQYPEPIQGEIMKIYCEANSNFFLAGRNGSVVMAPANESDPSQQWIMDTEWNVLTDKDEFIQGEIVKIYCEANPDFFLAGRNGSVVIAPANESDPSQQWIMDTAWNVLTDKDEFPAFALVNKATGKALKHVRGEKDKVTLGPYHPYDLNEAVLFTHANVGKGYQCIRPFCDSQLYLDASAGDDKQQLALRERAEKESQKWI